VSAFVAQIGVPAQAQVRRGEFAAKKE